MKSPALILSIPTPCHEDWNKMNPDERGRFCSACHKSIIDFSQLSDEGIIEILKREKQTCGRFYHSQLNRPVSVMPNLYQPRTIPWWKSLMIAATVFLFRSPVASAFKPNTTTTETAIYPQSKTENLLTPDSEKIVLKGNVHDAKTGEDLLGASIAVYDDHGRKIGGAATDIDGNFQITVPKIPDLTLKCFFLGYDTFVVQNIKESNANIQIGLHVPEGDFVVGMIIYKTDNEDFGIVRKYLDR